MDQQSPEQGSFEPTIALVFSPEQWVEALHRHLADHGGACVRQIVLEPSVALEEEYDTLVVSHRWPALSKPLIDGLHTRGRHVLGVFDPDEPHGRDHLRALGVDAVIAAPSTAAEFVAVLTDLGACRDAPVQPGSHTTRAGTHASLRSNGLSSLTAVAGPPGAGATEVTIELGRAVAAKGHEAVVVDADESHAAVATRLALPTEPNLRTALDAVQHGLGELPASLISLGPDRLRVLGGLPSADAAAHVRADEVVDVLRALAGSAQLVADLGSTWSHGIARAVVQEAGAVVGVGAGTPVGVARLLAWIAELRTATSSAPLHLIVNCAPADRFRRNEIATEIARTFEPTSLLFVPFDRKVDAAAWHGALVGRGPFTASLAPLGDLVAPRPVPRRVAERRQARRRTIAMGARVRTAGYE
jgi:MinD-like ATPase involved in chromosome partitioning or flagellar assembly